MKNLVFILASVFVLGCEGEPDAPPIMEVFECTFTNLKPKKYLKFTFDCLERKQKDSNFSIMGLGEYELKDNTIIITREEIEKQKRKIDKFYIYLSPYFPIGFSRQQQDEYVGTKLTYIMRIYKDEQLIYEKELKYPKEDYPVINIDL